MHKKSSTRGWPRRATLQTFRKYTTSRRSFVGVTLRGHPTFHFSATPSFKIAINAFLAECIARKRLGSSVLVAQRMRTATSRGLNREFARTTFYTGATFSMELSYDALIAHELNRETSCPNLQGVSIRRDKISIQSDSIAKVTACSARSRVPLQIWDGYFSASFSLFQQHLPHGTSIAMVHVSRIEL